MTKVGSKGRLKGWPMRLLVALDQLANALLLGLPDETISSRAAKAARRGKRWGCVLCWLLDKIDRDHCERVIELDEA
ncbi:MAG TPA: hypothetical protein VEA79_00210 [Phenylobacterium sp.]|nr:hypothetical protein [Phenylobacterium sp.]